MSKTQPWYIAERSDALTVVYLTRRDDLVVRRQEVDGVDYIVEIVKNSRSTKRIFGVQVTAQIDPLGSTISQDIASIVDTQAQSMQELPFPVCLFFFTMQYEEAFYVWLTEPLIADDGAPKLHTYTNIAFQKLDTPAIDRIVQQVNQWYDALFKALAA
jgi:hypothetical protein